MISSREFLTLIDLKLKKKKKSNAWEKQELFEN